jgi:hypothetical protein
MDRDEPTDQNAHLDITPDNATKLRPQDTFCFSCTQCGECCFDQVVLLDPFDLFYLSRVGSLPGVKTTTDLFEGGYIELALIDEEWRCALTMPRFQRGTKCRFLTPTLNERGKILGWFCELHERGAKPLVCTSSPIARDVAGAFYLVAPVDTCPGMKQGEPEALQEYLRRLEITQRLDNALWLQQLLRKSKPEAAMRLYDFDQGQMIDTEEELEGYLRELQRTG